MSNQWNNNQFQQGLPSQGSQVKMFDPTQFHTTAALGGAQANKPRLHAKQQNVVTPTTPQAPQQAAQSSWSSWSSWAWNSDTANSQTGDQQQQTQQPVTMGYEHQQIPNDGAGGNQYYSKDNFSTTWNQGWDGAHKHSLSQQTSVQSDSSALYQNQELQQEQSQWGHQKYDSGSLTQDQHGGGLFGQGQYGGGTFGQGQHGGGTFDTRQHAGNTFHEGQHGQGIYDPSQHGGGTFGQDQQTGSTFDTRQHTGNTFNPNQHGGGTFNQGQHGGGTFGQGQHIDGTFHQDQHSGSTFDSRQHGGSTYDPSQLGGGVYDPSQHGGGVYAQSPHSGSTFGQDQQTGSTFDSRQHTGSTYDPGQRSGGTYDPSPHSGSTYDQSQHGEGIFNQGQYAEGTFSQDHHGGDTHNTNQHGSGNVATLDQSQQDEASFSQVHYHANDPSGLQQYQNQQRVTSQFYDHQQQVSDESQGYSQSHEQYQSQTDTLYNNPYNTNAWIPAGESGQFSSNQGQESYPGNVRLQEQQVSTVQNRTNQSLPLASRSTQFSHNSGLARPGLEVYNADDDGTVSGFAGRDDDGNVQLGSQRYGHSYDESGSGIQGNEISSGLNQFLAVSTQFHRTDSDISNVSLSTSNISNSEEDDGRRFAPKKGETVLAQRQNNPIVGDKAVVGQHHNQDVYRELAHTQVKGINSEFSSGGYLPQNLPLDTSIRPPTDVEHPDSAESGGSGGSSGLTDWEIVPPQTGSINLSYNNSLDFDKPDGGMSMSVSYGNFEQQDTSLQQVSQSLIPFSDASDQNANFISQKLNPSEHSSTSEALTMFGREPVQSPHDTSGQFGRSAITDHYQKDSIPYTLQSPLQASSDLPPTSSSNLPMPLLSQPDRTANPFRRDDGRTPGRTTIPQSSNSSYTSSSTPLTLEGEAWPAERKITSTNYSSDLEKTRDIKTVPSSAPKLPVISSAEDGNRISRQGSDHNTTDNSQTKEFIHSSEELDISGHHQRHHSAFQPVSRPQQTVMSPATTLWDNSETSTSNILLAPVMPLIIPALNSYSVPATVTATTGTDEISTIRKVSGNDRIGDKPVSKQPEASASLPAQQRGGTERKDKQERGKEMTRKEDINRSFDSLDEIDAVVETQRDRNSQSHHQVQAKESSHYENYNRLGHDKQVSDISQGRNNPPTSLNNRNRQSQLDQLPPSGTELHSKEDPYRRNQSSYRDYGDSSSYDERYDRPRSSQDESNNSRPSSRSGQEVTRPRSRADYDHDRDYYYRSRDRGYGGHDSYGRDVDYYNEERGRYYRYSREKEAREKEAREKEARYTRAYYEEYYGAKYEEYYKQLQQHQQHRDGRLSSRDLDQSSSRSHSRSSSLSRGSTPAIAASPGPDYYGSHDSRPSSRTDHSRADHNRTEHSRTDHSRADHSRTEHSRTDHSHTDHYQDDYNRRYASYDGYNAYYEGYGYDPYTYGYAYPGYDGYTQAYDQGRMTPPKYSYPHVRVSFGPSGQLVKVLPNRPKDGQPAILDILDIQMILESFPESEELRMFPGPMISSSTHKKDVLLFCQQKARACAENITMMDRESAQLIWRFLELLIKQNGSVVGTDLSDLLLEGHEPSTHEYSVHGMKISQSSEALDTVPEGNSEDSNSARESPAVRVTSDRTAISSADREREKWVDRFRHLLLYGRKKDALECAMKNNLWGHALFLASKMDTRTHANVMTRFANGAMRMNDPLQTLYQLMSGRQPAAVTCVVDERWGDWRPHLAMILANQSSKHDIDSKSIATLGDALAAKGYLYASHFCYLMAQVNFGNYFKKTSKIVLIGTSHNLPLEEFATNEAIQCTEVYEYAQRLGNPGFCLPHLQIYKYMYACRLVDYGMVSEALNYCEVIAKNIQQNPTWFQAPFAQLVCEMSRKLQLCDPQHQIAAGEEGADQLWLQQLENVCGAYNDGYIQPLSGKDTPAGYPETSASSESGDYNQFGNRYSEDVAATHVLSSAPDVDVYGYQFQSQSVPENTGGEQQQDVNAVTGQMQNLDITDQQQQQQQQQQQGYGQEQHYQHHQYGYTQWQQQYAGSHLDSTQQASQLHSQVYSGYEGEQQLPPRASMSTNEVSEDEDDDNDDNDDDVLDGSAAGFDYFGNVGTQKVVAPPHRYRSMSGSSTGSTRRRRTISGSSTGSVKVSPHKTASQQLAGDMVSKAGQQDNRGSGWFGGLFSKFKAKGKNEMILPDDKNPPIVWDPVKKKWINADGTEEDDVVSKAPPPKDIELLGKTSVTVPTSVGAPPPSSSAESNRFSLKAKGARNQYVDVNNPTRPGAGQMLLNTASATTLPTVASSTSAAFIPGSEQTSSTEIARNVNTSSVENSLLIGQYPSNTSDMATLNVQAQQVPSMPVLFNPTSLKTGSVAVGQAASSTGPGLKYGQRRTYPK